MSFRFPKLLAFVLTTLLFGVSAHAGDLRISIPKRSKYTKVQKLNRDGVKALEKHDTRKAKKLFYSAYLIDPGDPFTLNNLGYIAELEGEVDRAQRYYALAAEVDSEADVDEATAEDIEGKPLLEVAGTTAAQGMQVNRLNVRAIGLLQKDRAAEAELVLQQALQIEPNNPFTLNNMGFARELQGEWESAMSYYLKAAGTNSDEQVIVTSKSDWRGEPISSVAKQNAGELRDLMREERSVQARVARLNLRGVSAINRNDRRAARQYFEQAYQLDGRNAFTMNNMGYLAEMEGDRETANFFYAKAREARNSEVEVGMATRREAEGQPVGEVAQLSTRQVNARLKQEVQAKRAANAPIILKRRDGSAVLGREPEPEQPSQDALPAGDETPVESNTTEPLPMEPLPQEPLPQEPLPQEPLPQEPR